jgi:hypothetical protein
VTEPKRRAQAFVELRAEDPEATSAFAVARSRLAAGRTLEALRRVRVFELAGALPERAALAERLHGSTQFYNPVKERCVVRAGEGDLAPFAPDETLVLVLERGGERRPGAERWWRREAGERVEVREGVVWAMRFAPGGDAVAHATELAVTRDRAHGLLANPHFQDVRVWPDAAPPLDWLSRKRAPAPKAKRARRSA